jgi:hypothetical protein
MLQDHEQHKLHQELELHELARQNK